MKRIKKKKNFDVLYQICAHLRTEVVMDLHPVQQIA